jgi:hypothetical protein
VALSVAIYRQYGPTRINGTRRFAYCTQDESTLFGCQTRSSSGNTSSIARDTKASVLDNRTGIRLRSINTRRPLEILLRDRTTSLFSNLETEPDKPLRNVLRSAAESPLARFHNVDITMTNYNGLEEDPDESTESISETTDFEAVCFRLYCKPPCTFSRNKPCFAIDKECYLSTRSLRHTIPT